MTQWTERKRNKVDHSLNHSLNQSTNHWSWMAPSLRLMV